MNGIHRKNDMIRIKIPCGTGYQEAEFADNVKMELIDPPKKEVLTSIDFLIRNTLDPPIGTPRLEEMVNRRTKSPLW